MSKLPWIDSLEVDWAYEKFKNRDPFCSDRTIPLPLAEKKKQSGTEEKVKINGLSESPCN